MKNKKILAIAIIISMICFGCKKNSDDTSADYANTVVGAYSGTWVVVGTGQTYGMCTVVKVSATSVNFQMTAGGSSLPTIPGVKLSDGGNGKIKCTYTDSSGSLNGTFENKTISFSLVAGTIHETFTGTKP
jgi:hypothetical protein